MKRKQKSQSRMGRKQTTHKEKKSGQKGNGMKNPTIAFIKEDYIETL